MVSERLIAFFWKRVVKSESCWEWRTGKGNKPKIYGNITLYGGPEAGLKCVSAHRASWLIHNGEIPDKLQVLHNCDNPACVRPDHLRLGTQSENLKEAFKKGRKKPPIYQSLKTHCPQGHPYDEKNTGYWFGKKNGYWHRICRTCQRERWHERKESRKNLQSDKSQI